MNAGGRLPRRDGRVAMPPELADDAHKGDAGRVLCLAGSRAMPGAAVLVVRAACRAGAGLVTLGCLARELLTIVPIAAPEALLADLADADWSAPDGPRELAGRRDDACVAGPGLGRGERSRAIVRRVVRLEAAAVLDADALNEVGTELRALRDARGALVLTPHPGEAARLLGRDVPSDDDGRRAAALAIARGAGAVTVLKGRRTVVVSADGERVAVNTTGNPGMATGGSGDVLAGILAAYLAATRAGATGGAAGARDRFDAFDAARAAVAVHGRAGDLAAAELGRRALIASDLVAFLPRAQREAAEDVP